VSKPSAVPAWFRDVPPNLGTEEDGQLDPHAPHPADLTPQELAEWMGPDYSSSSVASSTPESFLDPLWWSLGNAAEFFEINAANDDSESSPLFSGLKWLERKIRTGELKAYGSIDAAPVTAIGIEAWTEFEMIAHNITSKAAGAVRYDVLVRSRRAYRASALRDHAFPSGETVPSAFRPEGEPGYHRIVSNVFVNEREARELLNGKVSKPKDRPIGPKQQRLAETLELLTIGGRKVYPDRRKLSFAKIARLVVNRWEEEDKRTGELVEYNLSTEEQAVRRFYNATR
jgi:hypothetical protein